MQFLPPEGLWLASHACDGVYEEATCSCTNSSLAVQEPKIYSLLVISESLDAHLVLIAEIDLIAVISWSYVYWFAVSTLMHASN